ncbi:hypothetical protein [Vibrio marisflavi]|uniref:Lipoprotein n=1 Tax=Vibrio marisflavi CECT 7928 TaxID=634439 RepID=A0ABN8E4U0_9VIBR|nr:hypothetical protein [Vibrio marisflavi]CAH0540533.1 hypothetical protein VMF7928_02933 [Vibrio marisflavi CECT 7928]
MVNFIERKILSTSVLLLCVTACGGGGGSEGTSAASPTGNSERTQSEIEAMASLALASHSPSEDFNFSTQRQVNFQFDFTSLQSFTQLSIYIQDGDEPASLLEQVEISNSSHYNTSLSVPTYFNSVLVVLNNNTSVPYSVAIDSANVAVYTFSD